MPKRKFLQATVATSDNTFVAVVEHDAKGWSSLTAGPQNTWPPELREKAMAYKPSGSWVRDSSRGVWGKRGKPSRSSHPELFRLRLRAIGLHDAILSTEGWLGNFSSKDTLVSLKWENVTFTRKSGSNPKSGTEYEVYLTSPANSAECLYRLKQSALLNRVRLKNGQLLVRFVPGCERMQIAFQELADLLP